MDHIVPISDNQLEKLLEATLANKDGPRVIFGAEQVIGQLIDRDQWTGARKLIDRLYRNNPRQLDANRKVLAYKLAQQLEIDENFEDSLKYYESSSTETNNAARVILKRTLDSAASELDDYLAPRPSLQRSWNKSLLLAVRGQRSLGSDHANEIDAERRPSKTNFTPGMVAFDADSIPRQMREFFSNSDPDKWSNNKNLNSMKTIGSSLSPIVRSALAENAILYHRIGWLRKACDLYLCLDLQNSLIDTLTRDLEPASVLKFVCHFGYPDGLLNSLIDHVHHVNKRQADENEANLFMAYLKLGLADEALQVLVADCFPDEGIISEAVRYLDEQLQRDSDKILFDPVLKRCTLIQVQRSLLNDPAISGHVITMIILILNAFLYKLDDTADPSTEADSISKLEIIFKQLSKSLKGLNFDTSDILVRATNSMVRAVKDKLDALAGSDIIRGAFKSLVETIADRCMVEGRYKSAAALYSQIEDNMSAIKSLMRLGDADIVINFSLLVRDIVVNRLTINYLKHLNADPRVIEDFIAKSRV